MAYNAKVQRGIMVFLFVMTVVLLLSNIIGNNFSKGLLYFHIIILLFSLFSFFIQYKLEIKDGYLTYQFLFIERPLYKRVIHPYRITNIKFVRFGWSTKGAIIQINKGINIRVFNFEPNNVFLDLLDFANQNSISIQKTKDYQILERMKET